MPRTPHLLLCCAMLLTAGAAFAQKKPKQGGKHERMEYSPFLSATVTANFPTGNTAS